MNFLGYLLLGGLSYAAGWFVRRQLLPKTPTSAYRLTHPTIIKFLAGFFVLMLVVSWLIGRYLLSHETPDVMYIVINSAAATFVYSFGLNPERRSYDVPD